MDRNRFKKDLRPDRGFIEELSKKYSELASVFDNPDKNTITLILKSDLESNYRLEPIVIPKHLLGNQELEKYSHQFQLHDYVDKYRTFYKEDIQADVVAWFKLIKSTLQADFDCYIREKSDSSIKEKEEKKLLENNRIISRAKSIAASKQKSLRVNRSKSRPKNPKFTDLPNCVDPFSCVKAKTPYLYDIIGSRIVLKELNGSRKDNDLIQGCYTVLEQMKAHQKE